MTVATSRDSFASPRSHSRHQRHSNLARTRHSKQFEGWLMEQANRLSTTEAAVSAKLDTYTAEQIAAAANLAAIP